MTKKVLFTSAAMALALSAGSALAADLPSRKGPPVYAPPPPLFSWAGLYVGVNAGGTWSDDNNVDTATAGAFLAPGFFPGIPGAIAAAGTASIPVSIDGFIGGGQVGYNLQFGAWVGGIEADIQGIANGERTGTVALAAVVPGAPLPFGLDTSAITSSRTLDWLGTVRGRLGYLVMPNLLLYGTGGMAIGAPRTTTTILEQLGFIGMPAFGNVGTFSETRIGWTAGGGVEWMFWPNWSAKVEYLRYDLDTVTNPLSPLVNISTFFGTIVSISNSVSRAQFTGNIVRAGLNYHFNFAPAPVAATY